MRRFYQVVRSPHGYYNVRVFEGDGNAPRYLRYRGGIESFHTQWGATRAVRREERRLKAEVRAGVVVKEIDSRDLG